MTNHRRKNKESGSLLQKEMNLIEKDITIMKNPQAAEEENESLLQKEMNLIEKDITIMKNLQAAEEDQIVIEEVPATGAITVVNTTRSMTGDIGININADTSIFHIEDRTHQNTGGETITTIMNLDQGHQHTRDIKLIKKTVQKEEGDIEIHLGDQGKRDEETTRLITERDMKNTVVHIVDGKLLGKISHREIEVLITRTLARKETETKMTIASRMEKEIP